MRDASPSRSEEPPSSIPYAVLVGTLPSDQLPESSTVEGSGEGGEATSGVDAKVVIETHVQALGQLAKTCRSARNTIRSRHDELLSGVAVAVCLATLAGLHTDRAWCTNLAKSVELKWTAMSSTNPKAALCRIMSHGLITGSRASRVASAVDSLLCAEGAALAGMALAEREKTVIEAYRGGVGNWVIKRAGNDQGQSRLSNPRGPVLVGPGLELFQPGQRLRAVLEWRDDGAIELVYVAAEDTRVQLMPNPTFRPRALGEIKKVDETAQQAGKGEETLITTLAKPDFLRIAASGAISAVSYSKV